MGELVFNSFTGQNEAFSGAINDMYNEFSGFQNRPARVDEYDSWRQRIKDKYPRDYSRLLAALSKKLESEKIA